MTDGKKNKAGDTYKVFFSCAIYFFFLFFFLCNLDKVSQRPNKDEREKSCKDKWGRAF